jgi:hypothetical protein
MTYYQYWKLEDGLPIYMYDTTYNPLIKCPKTGRFANFTTFTESVSLDTYWCLEDPNIWLTGSLASKVLRIMQI